MIKYFCDICGAEKSVGDIYGVGGKWRNGITLTPQDGEYPRIGECEKHICADCLAKLGWKATPEEKGVEVSIP